MMRNLAWREPALPFDDGAAGREPGQFSVNPEFTRAWLPDVENDRPRRSDTGFSLNVTRAMRLSANCRSRRIISGTGFGPQAMAFVADRARALGGDAIPLEVDRRKESAGAVGTEWVGGARPLLDHQKAAPRGSLNTGERPRR